MRNVQIGIKPDYTIDPDVSAKRPNDYQMKKHHRRADGGQHYFRVNERRAAEPGPV